MRRCDSLTFAGALWLAIAFDAEVAPVTKPSRKKRLRHYYRTL